MSASVTNSIQRKGALPPPSPEVLCSALGISSLTIDWLAGDGSDRSYYRISSPELAKPTVLMQLSGVDAEALQRGGYDWVTIAGMLAARGIVVPRVLSALPDHAALVIEDYGDRMLEGQVFGLFTQGRIRDALPLYDDCFSIIGRFLAIPQDPAAVWCQRRFDADRYIWELNFFLAKYAGPVAGIKLTPGEREAFDRDVKRLSEFLARAAKYFVHRDFHSRNLMYSDGKLAVLDFQDARIGPASYDLVSLCFDSYVPFDKTTRSELMERGTKIISEVLGHSKIKLESDVANEINAQWRPMLLQRQLKAIGSFGFLTVDKNKGDYLKYAVPAATMLEAHGVADERWPFLSDTLVGMLRKTMDRKF